MVHVSKKPFFYIALIMMLLIMLPTISLANSAQPPSLIILINNPPDNLTITLVYKDGQAQADVRKVAWEKYYVFYSLGIQKDDDLTFKVDTGAESFECTISEPITYYENVFTLDLKTHKITKGEYPFRSVKLIAARLILTLLFEGFIFWLAGYRKKRSWITFITVNLITQGLLYVWLNKVTAPFESYIIVKLVFGEIQVFVLEMIAFPLLIREKKASYSIIYAFISNFISLFVGALLLDILPI